MDRICGNGETLVRGKYMLFTNLWGAATGSGSQCLWDAAAGGTDDEARIAWGTSWDWGRPLGALYRLTRFAAAAGCHGRSLLRLSLVVGRRHVGRIWWPNGPYVGDSCRCVRQ